MFSRSSDSLNSKGSTLPKSKSVGAYHESNSISELKFTLRLNLLGLLDSHCISKSLSSVLMCL